MSDDAYVNTVLDSQCPCVCVFASVSEYLQHMIAMLDLAPLAGFEIRLQLALGAVWKLRNVNKSSEAVPVHQLPSSPPTFPSFPLSLFRLFMHLRLPHVLPVSPTALLPACLPD